MTKFAIFPRICKVLRIIYSKQCYNGYCHKSVVGRTIVIGKYYVAEHSKTPGLSKGDKFIIKTIDQN